MANEAIGSLCTETATLEIDGAQVLVVVNWAIWVHMPKLSPPEAVALSFGCDPMKTELFEWASPTMKSRNPVWACDFGPGNGGLLRIVGFADRLVLFQRTHPAEGISFRAFARWAREVRWELPSNFPNVDETLEKGSPDAELPTAAESRRPSAERNGSFDSRAAGPGCLDTSALADAFDGIGGRDAYAWKVFLGNVPNWLLRARMAAGRRGVAQAKWDPVQFGRLLMAREVATERDISRRFRDSDALKKWRAAWETVSHWPGLER